MYVIVCDDPFALVCTNCVVANHSEIFDWAGRKTGKQTGKQVLLFYYMINSKHPLF